MDIGAGVYAYTEAPDFEILLVGYKYGDAPTRSFMPAMFAQRPGVLSAAGAPGEQAALFDNDIKFDTTGSEAEFLKLLKDPTVIKTAYNANFERTCLAKYYGVKCNPDEWRDTMILATALGLPRSLEGAGEALGLGEDKQKLKIGRALIQYFCKPCKPTRKNGNRTRNYPRHDPKKWELFITYNLRDVDSEQEILRKCIKYRPNAKEQKLWSVDQSINDRGIRINRPMAEGIVEYEDQHHAALMKEATELTGLDNPNSIAQLKVWLSSQGEAALAQDCSKAAVAAALRREDLSPKVRRVLEIRQALGKTSTKKYEAMLNSACRDDRVRGMLQFYGANRTGRWAGQIVQLQNLPQNHIEDLDVAHDIVCDRDWDTLELMYGEPAQVFSELVRTAFIPSEGNHFIVTDFSAIEARVIAWLAGQNWRLDVFRNGGDIYCASASKMFGVPVVKHGINGNLRQQGKVAELALGYGGGVGAIATMDKNGAIPEERRQPIVDQWRKASPNIVKLWTATESAAKKAITEHRTKSRAVPIKYHNEWLARHNEELTGADPGAYSDYFKTGAAYYYQDGILFCQLPSGRSIAYYGARIEDGRYGPEIRYYGVGQESHAWTLLKTYGGKLTENLVQATARDCLAEKMVKAEAMGYHVVAHIHDEMIIDVPRTDTEAFNKIDGLMAEPIDWAPGLPLKGGTYACDYYQKD